MGSLPSYHFIRSQFFWRTLAIVLVSWSFRGTFLNNFYCNDSNCSYLSYKNFLSLFWLCHTLPVCGKPKQVVWVLLLFLPFCKARSRFPRLFSIVNILVVFSFVFLNTQTIFSGYNVLAKLHDTFWACRVHSTAKFNGLRHSTTHANEKC